MMTGRCLRLPAGVYNYAQDCGQQGLGRLLGLGPLRAQPPVSLCLPRNFASESPGAKLEALGGNFTLPHRVHSHFRSPKVSDRDWDTSHTHTPKYTSAHIHGGDSRLQQALIKLCSWALLLLSLVIGVWLR